MDNEYLDTVEQCLGDLIQEFKQNPDFFYGEWDAKYYLYHLLTSREIFKARFQVKENISVGLVHAEYPAVSRFLVDLVVFDPRTLQDYPLGRQRVMCQIEMKSARKVARYDSQKEEDYRARLEADTKARKYFVYLIKNPAYKQEFREALLRNKEAAESILLENEMAIVTKI